MKTVIFPQHPFDKYLPDPDFQEEYNFAKIQGFSVILFDYDNFISNGLLQIKPGNDEAIYRGWMMKPNEYQQFFNIVSQSGYNLINNADEYKNCHYFNEVYTHIKNHTPTSVWLSLNEFKSLSNDAILNYLKQFNGHDVIIKDYVKSEKGSDLFKIPTNNINTFIGKVNLFIEKRGKLFNDGIVFKQVVDMKKVNGHTNEWRIFVYKGQIITATFNNESEIQERPELNIIEEIIPKIKSNFYTIDLGQKSDGSWFIMETGDGQVSGLSPNQNILEFYSKLI